ncbi:cleavage and polyadenylation specificity factor subunit 2 [Rhizoclosmatium sp. JEL0117]|nr:cleavage and polyadenylation specificity factor subunit 2 [Rhizoclosmatium sp. JEL0117]
MSLVRFTSLTGANDGSTACVSHVLQVDNCRILLDCGASGQFDPIDFRALGGMAKNIDAVLLTHADPQHLGGYAYAHAKLGLTCPCYATGPVAELGKLCMREFVHSLRASQDFVLFGADEINAAFDSIVSLRYSQQTPLTGKGTGITVTAFQAGHSLGGTFWKIKKGTDEILYAVDYNHIMERHLDRTVLNAKDLERPSVLITDAYNAQYSFLNSQNRRPLRDNAFFENIRSSLRSGGNVLIPVASTTRSLELTFLLEDYWARNQDLAKNFPHIYFLSPMSPRVLHAARRNTEWMGQGIAKLLTQQDHRLPFDFRHITAIQSLEEIDQSPTPKVIFASSMSLESGFSRQIFLEWCQSQTNLVLLPDRGDPGTLARQIYDIWMATDKLSENVAVNVDIPLSFQESRRVPLQGEELEQFRREEEARKEAIAAAAEAAKLTAMEENDSDLSDNEDDPDTLARKAANVDGAGAGAVGNLYDIYVKDVNRSSGFFKRDAGYRMFPVVNTRSWIDDYGEAVDASMFVNKDTAAMEEAEEEIEETRDLQDTIPSKYVTFTIDVRVACKVIFVDFEGRSDGKSIRNILTQVAPRKLVLIHGSEEATADLESYSRETGGLTNDVFAPHNNEWINVSAASDIYEIKLTDSLINDYELSYVSGYIKFDEQEDSGADATDEMDVDQVNKTRTNAVVPTLDILSAELSKSHRPVIVGDVKLSEFRKLLVSKGFETEFVSGVLVVNRSIMVRKSQQGRLVLEGSLSPDYYAVRKLLYAEHAIL